MEDAEPPLHPTPMLYPMMKGKMTVDASRKPTFQGIWGMTHQDVNKGGYTNDFKVVRMASVTPNEEMPKFAGEYQGYFKLATKENLIETVPETFSLRFVPHTNHGYNVYGAGTNKYGHNTIVGTVTPSGKMEIFKIPPGATAGVPVASQSAQVATPRAKSSGGTKKKSGSSAKKTVTTPDNKFGMPGLHVKTLKDAVMSLMKGDKGSVFRSPVPGNIRGQRGLYSDVIKRPMDLGTVMTNIDTKYRTAAEAIADIRLVFSNAKFFNVDTDPVNALATSLSGRFEAFLGAHQTLTSGLDRSKAAATSRGAEPSGGTSSTPAPSASLPATPVGPGGVGKRLASPPPPAPSAPPVTPVTLPIAVARATASTAKRSGSGPSKGSKALSWEEQDKLAKDVNEVFRLGNEQPDNERAQARVYALWSFAKAYVLEKDRVMVDAGKGAEIRMDALNVQRQRQLRDVVKFFLEDEKKDPPPQPKAKQQPKTIKDERPSEKTAVEKAIIPTGGPRKRSRSDLSDSEDEEGGVSQRRDGSSPGKRSRDGSVSSPQKQRGSPANHGDENASMDDVEKAEDDLMPTNNGRVEREDSTRLILEANAGQETEINLDLEDEEEEEDEDESTNGGDKKDDGSSGGDGFGVGGDSGDMDSQWSQAQAEKKEREDRERARAASEKALEEQRVMVQELRQKARVEEGLKLSRERAAEKARLEALALDKKNKEKAELEERKEAERLAREEAQPSVDLDQCRADQTLMSAMDESVYDD